MLKTTLPAITREKITVFRDRFLIGMVDWTKPYYVAWFKKNHKAWKQNIPKLKSLAKNSLGYDLGCFLEKEELVLMPKLEEHDVIHVLLQYETTVKDEARMQFFLLGNGKRSLYALFTAIASTLLIPEHLGAFIREFKKGRKCRCIARWNFEHLLSEPTHLLRSLIYRKDVGVEAPLVF